MVTVLFPMSRGTVADQTAVPLAMPDAPKLVLQVTCFTPMLSLAVPFSIAESAEVDIVAVDGEVMVSAGGVVSLEDSRVTVTVFET
jgi:hypothetical protein